MALKLILVFIGGGLGSMCRFGISYFFSLSGKQNFPWATLTANSLSMLIMALVVFAIKDQLPATWTKFFLLIGFCGGFSTFSTFGYETYILLKTHAYVFAAANVLLSVVVGLVIFSVSNKFF